MARRKKLVEAVAYLRVSSKGQVRGHGYARQREEIQRFAKGAGYQLIEEYREAHTGSESDRPVFALMIEELLSNGCQVIIVESKDRFAREMNVELQLLGYLKSKGIELISAVTGESCTDFQGDPMREAMSQIQTVFAQLEKRLLVRKLKKAREEKKARTGRCEGRLRFGEHPEHPDEVETLARLKELRRKPRGRPRLSCEKIAQVLNAEGRRPRTGDSWNGPKVSGVLRTIAG